jgi:uncharacterized damage-inducible protein DinB
MNLIRLLLVAAILAGALCAQPPQAGQAPQGAPSMVTEAKGNYTAIKNNLMRMAEKMPAEMYDFKPVPEIRSFGEAIAHVADSQARMCSGLTGEQKSVDAASKKTKDELVAAFKATFDICDAAWDATTDANAAQAAAGRGNRTRLGALIYNTTHDNEEYGYLAVYMRLKGIVPPSSDRSGPGMMPPAEK